MIIPEPPPCYRNVPPG